MIYTSELGCTIAIINRKLFFFFSMLFFLLGSGVIGCGENLPQANKNKSAQDNSVKNRLLSGTPLPVNNSFDKIKFSAADITKGGQLYDSWFTVLSAKAPVTINPIWSLSGTTNTTAADTWRCSSCHGWDYRGVNGNFGDTTNPRIQESKASSPRLTNLVSKQSGHSFAKEV